MVHLSDEDEEEEEEGDEETDVSGSFQKKIRTSKTLAKHELVFVSRPDVFILTTKEGKSTHILHSSRSTDTRV